MVILSVSGGEIRARVEMVTTPALQNDICGDCGKDQDERASNHTVDHDHPRLDAIIIWDVGAADRSASSKHLRSSRVHAVEPSLHKVQVSSSGVRE